MREQGAPDQSRRSFFLTGLRWIAPFVTIGVLFSIGQPARALPMFARKYNLPCARCHTMPPRLTPFGYAFYRAGYRLPSNEMKPYTLSNSVSLLADFTAKNTNPGGDTGFDLENVEAWLLTPIGKQFAVHLTYHIATTSGDKTQINETWLQYNSAPKGSFWSLRAGQLPVLDGYQLLGDRSFTFTDAQLFGSNGPLTGTGQGSFAIASLERGLEGGYTSGPFSLRASWLNGVDESGNGQIGLAGRRAQDLALQTDYLIGREGSGVGAFYYLGKQPLTSMMAQNPFQRAGLFGTYARTLKKGAGGIPAMLFELNGGLLWGEDAFDTTGHRADSTGSLLEADLYWHNRTSLGLRYDRVQPSNMTGVSNTEAYTLAVAHRPNDFMRLELQLRNQQHPSANSVVAELWFFY